MNQELIKDETDIDNLLGKPHKTILFNDETHSTVEVTLQIQKAIHCDPVKASEIMLKAHSTGSAIVFVGNKEKCEHVSAVLEEIRLSTKVEQV